MSEADYATVAGVDPSITKTGMARRATDWSIEPVEVDRVVTKPEGKDPSWEQRSRRLSSIAGQVAKFVGGTSNLVIYEGPSYASRGGRTHDLAGNWWITLFALIDTGADVLVVTPGERAKYATGRGNASKEEVMAAVIRRYPDINDILDDNLADAVVLMAIGLRLLDRPLELSLPKINLTVMDGIEARWRAHRG